MNEKIESLLQSAFENYNFGENVSVVDMDGWENDGGNDFLRVVYVQDTIVEQSTSDKVSFHVVLNADKTQVEEVYALMVTTGNMIGENFNKASSVKNKM